MARKAKAAPFVGEVYVAGLRVACTRLEPVDRSGLPSHVSEALVGVSLHSPRSVHRIFAALIGDSDRERFWALALDSKHSVIAAYEVSVGTLTTSLVHPREVFGPALRMGAAAVVVAHNHPSGDPSPSAEDEAVTQRLLAAGNLLGVPLLDHVVVGGERSLSLRERMGF
jgi:DNA repair protein RadC